MSDTLEQAKAVGGIISGKVNNAKVLLLGRIAEACDEAHQAKDAGSWHIGPVSKAIAALIAAVRAEAQREAFEALQAAKEALDGLEWGGDWQVQSPTCYWCGGYKRQPAMDQDYYGKPGHDPDCKRQKALQLVAAYLTRQAGQ